MPPEYTSLEELKRGMPIYISVETAAKIMDVTPIFLRIAMRSDKFPFGVAVEMRKQWRYWINTERFIAYMMAEDMKEKFIVRTLT